MLALTGRLGRRLAAQRRVRRRPTQLPAMNKAIDAAAEEAGRDPRAVRRLYNINGRFTAQGGTGFLDGPADVWVEQLVELALGEGISGFVLASDDPDEIRRFAGEVAPAVRDAVDLERASTDVAATCASARRHRRPLRRQHRTPYPPRSVSSRPRTTAAGSATERVWDEATRPSGPAAGPGRSYTAARPAVGQHLVDVHDHLRAELGAAART